MNSRYLIIDETGEYTVSDHFSGKILDSWNNGLCDIIDMVTGMLYIDEPVDTWKEIERNRGW